MEGATWSHGPPKDIRSYKVEIHLVENGEVNGELVGRNFCGAKSERRGVIPR